MADLHNPGRAVVIDLDLGKLQPPTEGMKMAAKYRKEDVSRSLYLITTPNRLVKRMQPIAIKKTRPHEYRNSLNTVERRGLCDWCDQTLLGNPLHRF